MTSQIRFKAAICLSSGCCYSERTFSLYVEHMEMGIGGGVEDGETMDQNHMIPPRIPPRNTSVIVSITGKCG